MAGDIVGASTFESFIQNDKPTIDAMNEAGLEVSAAGNHEFDQGYRDLMDRIMSDDAPTTVAPTGPTSRPTSVTLATRTRYALESDRDRRQLRALQRRHLVEDVRRPDERRDIRVGFVGAVTEDLGSLVAPRPSRRA